MSLSRRHLLQTAVAGLAGCSATPARYFRLAMVPGTVRNTPPQTISVRNISIPGYLDQSGIARASGDYQFSVFANDLWAESFGNMLQAILVQDLAQRLPDATVTASLGAVGTPADLRVEIDILRFDPGADGRVVLVAQVALKSSPGGEFLVTKTLQSSAMPAGIGAVDTVAVMSTLWGWGADNIADLIVRSGG
jgi:uncharacterized lipoprotein YmbA